MVTNKQVAEKLYKIADLLEIMDIRWEPLAYRRAARSIEDESQNLSQLYKQGGIKAIMEIDGVGKGISGNIEYMLKHKGKSDKFNSLTKEISKGVLDILQIPGMGPKKVKKLYQELGINSLTKLKSAAKKEKIQALEGFGARTEKEILRNIERKKKSQNRIPRNEALPIAKKIVARLKNLKEVQKVNYMGSLRRKKSTIGDIDILVSSTNPKSVMNFFTNMPEAVRTLVKGDTKSSILFDGFLQIDLRVVPPESYGAAAQYFTGSIEHNVMLRKIAIKQGYKLSEWGIFNRKTNEQITTKTEKSVYNLLGFKLIPPEKRIGGKEFVTYSLKKN
ncbi:MAG: helix-hairpin-helix domain-containing protein [Candidatus Nanoarchaeia archaeon]|jgi:DNA polymerase (family 10)|nr:helix-hairpin-helix domain-containing protein [Candidatus Nanoarchaeia archaeon]|tara:strand:+ start:246 stop:1244 length:999 start_codon:yes stop_codon:yes gene_type:complete